MVTVRASLLVRLLTTLLAIAVPTSAGAVRWGRQPGRLCEPPSEFYGPEHTLSSPPCCATQPGVCPGGGACPASGVCPGSAVPCVPTKGPTRPNVILVISDDQGSCHYGTAGECRSVQSGTPIPTPSTPNLDVLAAYGTIFPIAHNTASWCYPSLNSMLTGRYQRSMERSRNLGDDFVTLPKALRGLVGEAGTKPDPFEPSARIGGYCSLLGGKFTAAGGKTGFDAQAQVGRLGKLPCRPSPNPNAPPLCGTDASPDTEPTTLAGMRDLFTFIDAMHYQEPSKPGVFATQPFFTWYAPR